MMSRLFAVGGVSLVAAFVLLSVGCQTMMPLGGNRFAQPASQGFQDDFRPPVISTGQETMVEEAGYNSQ